MATKTTGNNAAYPIREPTADDAIELIGIISAAGGGDKLGEAIGLAIQAYHNENSGAIAQRAAVVAITDGLHAALRDPSVRNDARTFIYSLWSPKLSVNDGETFEQKKREEWKKLPMRAPLEILDGFRKTDNFGDFLGFFISMLPEASSETNSGA